MLLSGVLPTANFSLRMQVLQGLTDCIRAKRHVQRLERLFHQTSFTSDRRRWVEAIRAIHALITSKEHGFGGPELKLLQVTVRNVGEQ